MSWHQLMLIALLTLGCTLASWAQNDEVQVLLIGTSHWNNYQDTGLDVAQTNEVDILSAKYQEELAFIANKIAEFNPQKVFVERTLDYQPKLDSLYQLYSTSADWIDDKRNEIYQLGFRVAAKLNHDQVYRVDYQGTSLPFDSLMTAMMDADQEALMEEFQITLDDFTSRYNTMIREEKPLLEILEFLNAKEQRAFDLGWYLTQATQAGTMDNFIGPYLASEWMRRNIYTYSLIQKYVEESDERIMILLGASHIAVLENLIAYHPEWKVVELSELVR